MIPNRPTNAPPSFRPQEAQNFQTTPVVSEITGDTADSDYIPDAEPVVVATPLNLDPAYWINHVGAKVDIVAGNLVLSETGFLTVSTSPQQYALYVDTWTGLVAPICPRTDYRARRYEYRKQDCITLVAEWVDNHFGLSSLAAVKAVNRVEYRNLYMTGFVQKIIDFGFQLVTNLQVGDVVMYDGYAQCGVIVEEGKILYQVLDKFSCIDSIDSSKIQGIYRYAN